MIKYLEAGNYYGIDVRAQVLAEARKELEDSGLQDKAPVLLLMEQADSQIPGQLVFDRIWIFNTMIHMHDPILIDTIKFVSRHLSPLGVGHGTVYLGKRQTPWGS